MLEAASRELEAGVGPGGAAPGAAFLAPLDPLVWDREFLRSCYGFDYIWEVYVPAAKRRWGYYVLPILYGDRFVGRIEPRIDRKTDTLRILGAWWRTASTRSTRKDFWTHSRRRSMPTGPSGA